MEFLSIDFVDFDFVFNQEMVYGSTFRQSLYNISIVKIYVYKYIQILAIIYQVGKSMHTFSIVLFLVNGI